ncbi:hypothetical protein [Evansella clarkii]|uniref:hypothetical protein n=1 Tax=Evansella clarkii TaxID=79879 RepID=UPI000997A041|nr:hypothetical protein [Evansella clarkii]
MMTAKKVQTLKPAETTALPKPKKHLLTRMFGALLLLVSGSMFMQGIPLMFVFIAAYLGIPADATVGGIDTMVWLLTSVTMMVLAIYVFIVWIKFIWGRFITNPKPLFSLFKNKEKHAH